jgi:hypothetical protein
LQEHQQNLGLQACFCFAPPLNSSEEADRIAIIASSAIASFLNVSISMPMILTSGAMFKMSIDD